MLKRGRDRNSTVYADQSIFDSVICVMTSAVRTSHCGPPWTYEEGVAEVGRGSSYGRGNLRRTAGRPASPIRLAGLRSQKTQGAVDNGN